MRFWMGEMYRHETAGVYLHKLETYFNKIKCGIIGSIHGRFYAMDREKNWKERKRAMSY